MESCRIIALTGFAGSGKSTAREILRKRYQTKPVYFVSFADPVKDVVEVVFGEFGVTDAHLRGSRKTEPITISPNLPPVTTRQLMQAVGTELFRVALPKTVGWPDSAGQDIWALVAISRIRPMIQNQSSVVVIDDLRFPNELALLKKFVAEWNSLLGNGVLNKTTEKPRDSTKHDPLVTLTTVRIDRPGTVVADRSHPSEVHIPDLPVDRVIVNDAGLKEFEGMVRTI